MNIKKKLVIAIFSVAVVTGGFNLVERSGVGELVGISGLPTFVTDVKAEVGRPLSPVSVAGVARRSSR
jgi:hypothetical protein